MVTRLKPISIQGHLDIPYSHYLFLRLFSLFSQRKIVSQTSQIDLLVCLLFKSVLYSRASYNSENTVVSISTTFSLDVKGNQAQKGYFIEDYRLSSVWSEISSLSFCTFLNLNLHIVLFSFYSLY